jgi:hypothetical protein
MNMKKTKLLGFIAILVVLTLSGCDAILETFYPDFGENFGGGGGNNIRVFVEVIPGNDTVDPQIGVMVVREDLVEDNQQTDEIHEVQTVWPFWNWDEDGNLFLTANVEFFNIPDGEYHVVAWLERTTGDNAYNGFPDFDEPQRDAQWYPPGETDPTNFFEFPNEGGNFIEAEAFLEVFEGAAADHNFNMTGELILNIGALHTVDYVVSPVDTNLTIAELWFSLWGPTSDGSWGEVAFGDVPGGDTASFSIDYSNQTQEGYYWLDVSVQFSDGWSEYRGSEIRILSNEATASLDYYANVVIYDVLWWLDISEGETVDYKWGINSNERGRGELTVVNDEIVFSTTLLDYNPTAVTRYTDGVDMLGIKIDGDRDGEWDYYTEKPLGVSTGDLWGTGNDTVSLWFWSGDFRHSFRP